MSKNNRKILLVALVLTLVLIVGTTYAWLRLTKNSNTVNKITAGNLDLVLNEGENITLKNEVPRSYRQGMETKEYTFTITNNSSLSNYKLSLADLEKYTDEDGNEIVVADENRIDDAKIRYILLKDGEVATADKSKILADRVIDSGTIKKGQTITYSLRLWIDSRAEKEVMGKIFNARLSLVAEQTSNSAEVKPVSFENDSWDVISKAVKENNYPYKVGDAKTIDMGDLGTHRVSLSNISPCTNGETSETACGFVVEFADVISNHAMNSNDTNVGGWPASEMRTYVNTTVYNALPSDLQNVIATTKVISSHGPTAGEANFISDDKLYLLSCEEIYGDFASSFQATYDTSVGTSRQLDYYKKMNVTMDSNNAAIKQYNGTDSNWWLRSAYYYAYGDAGNFLSVQSSGSWGVFGSTYPTGVSPAFRIA